MSKALTTRESLQAIVTTPLTETTARPLRGTAPRVLHAGAKTLGYSLH